MEKLSNPKKNKSVSLIMKATVSSFDKCQTNPYTLYILYFLCVPIEADWGDWKAVTANTHISIQHVLCVGRASSFEPFIKTPSVCRKINEWQPSGVISHKQVIKHNFKEATNRQCSHNLAGF